MMSVRFNEKSPAKLNLFLKIIDKRKDGYHNLRSGITLINLYDEVLAEESSAFKVKYIGKFAPKNEIFKNCIVEKIFSEFDLKKPNYCFTIKKNIPIQSGLGSASSNAAAVIRILKKLNYKRLNKIDFSEIGADVPFFIKGGLQIGEGVGDQLNKLNKLIKGFYLLVIPEIHIDTTWAYNKWKNFLQSSKEKVNFARLIERDKIPFKLFENDFETIVVPAYPEIGKIIEIMQGKKALYTSL